MTCDLHEACAPTFVFVVSSSSSLVAFTTSVQPDHSHNASMQPRPKALDYIFQSPLGGDGFVFVGVSILRYNLIFLFYFAHCTFYWPFCVLAGGFTRHKILAEICVRVSADAVIDWHCWSVLWETILSIVVETILSTTLFPVFLTIE